MMIVVAFVALQQGISDLSYLPARPASYAVFNLKPIFTASVLRALTMPYSSLLCNFVFSKHSQQEVGGTSCAHNRKTENINGFVQRLGVL